MRKRHIYFVEFKARVMLEELTGAQTLSGLPAKHGVYSNLIAQ